MSETPDFELPAGNNGQRDNAHPRFYTKPIQNNFKSNAEGRPIFDDTDMVEILIPGSRNATWDGMVNEEHKKRWPREYAYFKKGQEAPTEGTPLTEWAGITRSQAEELAFAHVKTLEQLAALSDEQLNKTIAMGGFALREKAQRALDQAKGSAPVEKLTAENEALKGDNEVMKGQIAALQSQVEKLLAGTQSAETTKKG